MSDALRQHVSHRNAGTPQSEPARKDQVKNSAGGHTFGTGEANRLHRFLTIGTEGGTFYVGERELTRDNASVVATMASCSDPLLISQAVEVSKAGRAPSNNPALFAIAAAAGLGAREYRQQALAALPAVARTGMHILTFASYAEMFRGWGPQLVKGIRDWYTYWAPDSLAYQVLKYKQREGWSQRDLLRLAGRKGVSGTVPPEHERLFAYVMKGELGDGLPQVIYQAQALHATSDVAEWVHIIDAASAALSWEMLPSEALREARVWRALFENGYLPQTALLRNLSRFTNLGLLVQGGDAFTNTVAHTLSDTDRLVRARVHPMTVLLALKTYALGHSLRGSATWTPVSKVTDALDAAFYNAFGSVEPAGKRMSVNLDVSGSMGSPVAGMPISAREVTAAMSMITARTEPDVQVHGFSHSYMPLDISPRRRLDDNIRAISRLPYGGTDCAVPMTYALQHGLEVDVFQVWTDNETWYGSIHPHQALEQYRQKMGIDARLQVCATTPTQFSIADPLDPRQLDVSGFDAAVPNLLASHARGDI